MSQQSSSTKQQQQLSARVLIILTNNDSLGESGKKTGFDCEEFAHVYYRLHEAGFRIDLASIRGGNAPCDRSSCERDSEMIRRYNGDDSLKGLLANTLAINRINADDYDAAFFPGGHGPMWDVAGNEHVKNIVERFFEQHKLIAAICHGLCAFYNTRKDTNSKWLLDGVRLTGFTNSEEKAAKMDKAVPFLLEDMLKGQGALFERSRDNESKVVFDERYNILTGQNPASCSAFADHMVRWLQENVRGGGEKMGAKMGGEKMMAGVEGGMERSSSSSASGGERRE